MRKLLYFLNNFFIGQSINFEFNWIKLIRIRSKYYIYYISIDDKHETSDDDKHDIPSDSNPLHN